MIGPTDVVQPWMNRAARESDACLWHVSLVGGAIRRGCAAAGEPGCFSGPLKIQVDLGRLEAGLLDLELQRPVLQRLGGQPEEDQ